MANAALKASGDPKDKVKVANAMKTLTVDTPLGTLAWGKGPVPNVVVTPIPGGQWVKGTKWPHEFHFWTALATQQLWDNQAHRPDHYDEIGHRQKHCRHCGQSECDFRSRRILRPARVTRAGVNAHGHATRLTHSHTAAKL